ncbi:uncharacterized protein LODBEIA_P23910 [Lodderomyces beijingensis]|uniref:DUF3533 domain-containing protein n=1 Tax=Lodderomyces beijingensis TaxID=1775926 RepID=A0ABP0ZLB4_9ASCO
MSQMHDDKKDQDFDFCSNEQNDSSTMENSSTDDEKVDKFEHARPGPGGFAAGTQGHHDQNTPAQLPAQQSSHQTTENEGHSFFSNKLSPHRKNVFLKFCTINLVLIVFILTTFSIYWGSYYDRNSRYKDLKMLVVIEDEQVVEGVEPVFGPAMRSLLETPEAQSHGDWHIYSQSEYQRIADEAGNSIDAEIADKVYRQIYWTSIHVKPNATFNYRQALSEGNGDYNVTKNTVVTRFETGRDFMNMNQYIEPQLDAIEEMWLQLQPKLTKQLVKNIAIDSESKLDIVSRPMQFLKVDGSPWTETVLVAPCQVGFIYMIILTSYVFNFYKNVHSFAAKSGVKRTHFIIYRYICSIGTFFFISLSFGLVTLAFQADFTVTYGKSGFLVYWAIAFLTVCAVGFANEIMAMLLTTFYPPLLGCWVSFWVVINISPTFGPLALMSKFHRYGYAFPIHNSFNAVRTVFFDVYKGEMGRNIGILVAWWALWTCLFPVVIVYTGNVSARRAQAAAQAKQQAEKEEKATKLEV